MGKPLAQQQQFDDAFRYIDNNSNKYVEELRKLARQPSISAQGIGLEECAEIVKELMENRGITTRIYRIKGGPPIVYGEIRSSKSNKTLLLYDHYDVQPPDPTEEWTSDPFSAEVRNGTIYARGVSDDKASIVAKIAAAEAIKNTANGLPTDLKFVVEGEEEVDSAHLMRFLKENSNLVKADACLVEGGSIGVDGRPEIGLGFKGQLYVELRVKTAEVEQHSSKAAIIPNPGWRLIWALNSIKDENERVRIKDFYDHVKEPSNEDVEILEKIEFNDKAELVTIGAKSFVKGLKGVDALKRLIFEPACTISGLDSGYKGMGPMPVNPREAKAKIDFRLVPNQRCNDIYRKLVSYLKEKGFGDIECKKQIVSEACRTPPNARIVKVVAGTAFNVFGKKAIVWPMMPGSAAPPHHFTEVMGIPSVSGPCTIRFDNRAHAPEENLPISNFINGIKHAASIYLSF